METGCAARLAERITAKAEALKNAKPSADATAGALVLRDVYEREYAANYDARYGTPGAYARKLAASAEWEAGREERERKAQEQAEAEELAYLNMLKNESPEAKRTREKAEARAQRESERRSKAYRGRRYSYKPDNTDYVAYSAGAKAGDKISIDSQIDSSSRKGIE